MDIHDFFGNVGHEPRPDHPDFWRLSEIILELKGQMESAPTLQEKGDRWQASYEKIGDFASIKYCAVQAALQIMGIENGLQLAIVQRDKRKSSQLVGHIQAYFDGFLMGAEFMRRGGHRS